MCLQIGITGGFCEHCNEMLGSVKRGDFFTNQVTIRFSKGTLAYVFSTWQWWLVVTRRISKLVTVAIVVTFEQGTEVNAVHIAFMSASWQTTAEVIHQINNRGNHSLMYFCKSNPWAIMREWRINVNSLFINFNNAIKLQSYVPVNLGAFFSFALKERSSEFCSLDLVSHP